MIESMVAIEYNTWMSIIDHIGTSLKTIAPEYGLSGLTIQALPAYPRDLTKFQKPAIIVQKIHMSRDSIGFGNVLGMYTDDDGVEYDVSGSIYDIIYQLNIQTQTNTQCSRLTGAICEKVLSSEDGSMVVPLRNHIDPLKPEIGSITVGRDIGITSLGSNDNDDYVNAARIDVTVIQSMINPDQSMVDLSKGIKYTQNITL